MIRNFYKIAFRNILKEKFYSFINILGLTIGITGALFVIIYIADELSYDRFHSRIDQMYRIWINGKIAGQEFRGTWTSPPVAQTFADEIPEVEEACRINLMNDLILRNGDKIFTEDEVFYADSNFFRFFDFKLLQGDPHTALRDPNSIVLTETLARKYFGEETAIGKVMAVGNDRDAYQVTGIAATPPHNSHFYFTALISMSTMGFSRSTSWTSNSFQSYIILHPGSDLEVVHTKIREITKKYVGPELQQFMGISYDEFEQQGGLYGYFLQPVKDIHLHSHLDGELQPTSDISYLYIFGAIGLFILMIACINFMNMSTARSAGRAKEVGLRKTLGSMKSQLVFQFLAESTIYAFLAMILAILVFFLLLPSFNLLSGKELDYHILLTPWMFFTLLSITLLTGLLAGSYPAFYLTAFRAAETLKGNLKSGVKSGWIRATLVTVQFAISIILIICTSIVYRQLRFTQQTNLGFNKDQVMVIQNTGRLENNRKAFKDALLRQTGIIAASYSNYVIPGVNNTTIFRDPAGGDVDHLMGTYLGDYEHLQAMGYELVEGRNFSRDIPADSSAILLNQAAVGELGWDDPLGRDLIFYGGDDPITFHVIGILKDFHFESLRDNIRPIAIRLLNVANQMTVRFDLENPSVAIDLVRSQWSDLAPDEPFEFTFLDEKFDALYRAEQRLGTLFTLFTLVAIFIACLGLFGLAAFVAEQRTKEIGIRKAMGASTLGITTLLSKEFARFVLYAFLISIVPSYWLMTRWLEGFAYRIHMDPGTFLLGGLTAFLIALGTVSYQAVKAAYVNPAASLRYE
jgi:putative ABC transport system permease protein